MTQYPSSIEVNSVRYRSSLSRRVRSTRARSSASQHRPTTTRTSATSSVRPPPGGLLVDGHRGREPPGLVERQADDGPDVRRPVRRQVLRPDPRVGVGVVHDVRLVRPHHPVVLVPERGHRPPADDARDPAGVVPGDHVDGLVLDLGVRAPVRAQVLAEPPGGRRHDLVRVGQRVDGGGQVGQEPVPPLARPQRLARLHPVGDVPADLGVPVQAAVEDRGHDPAGEEPGAVLADVPPLVLRPPLLPGGRLLLGGHPGGPVLGGEEDGPVLPQDLRPRPSRRPARPRGSRSRPCRRGRGRRWRSRGRSPPSAGRGPPPAAAVARRGRSSPCPPAPSRRRAEPRDPAILPCPAPPCRPGSKEAEPPRSRDRPLSAESTAPGSSERDCRGKSSTSSITGWPPRPMVWVQATAVGGQSCLLRSPRPRSPSRPRRVGPPRQGVSANTYLPRPGNYTCSALVYLSGRRGHPG